MVRESTATPGRPRTVDTLPQALRPIAVVPYNPLPSMDRNCSNCGAVRFPSETPGFCCQNGKVELAPLEPLPSDLDTLFQRKHFMDNIRAYNQAFSFTSLGAKIVDMRGGPPSFKIQGQVVHRMGSLLPAAGSTPAYAQLYFFDTEYSTELDARGLPFAHLRRPLLDIIQTVLHTTNPYVRLL